MLATSALFWNMLRLYSIGEQNWLITKWFFCFQFNLYFSSISYVKLAIYRRVWLFFCSSYNVHHFLYSSCICPISICCISADNWRHYHGISNDSEYHVYTNIHCGFSLWIKNYWARDETIRFTKSIEAWNCKDVSLLFCYWWFI